MSGGIKKGKFVYKNQDSLNKMHAFYDKTLAALGVPYSEEYFEQYGKNLYIIEGEIEGLSAKDIANICATMKKRNPMKKIVAFIDYLQLVKADPDDRSQIDRKTKTDVAVTVFKALASQIGMPVFLLSSPSQLQPLHLPHSALRMSERCQRSKKNRSHNTSSGSLPPDYS